MTVLAVDVGRHKAKVAGPNAYLNSFLSQIGSARQLRVADEGDYRIQINGLEYFVGDLAEEAYDRRSMALETKLTDETRVLFVTACAAADVGEGTTVVTGLPVFQHTDAEKTAFINHLTGRYDVVYKGFPRTIDIARILIAAEGAGAYWHMCLDDLGLIRTPALRQFPVVRGIDFGSRTVNYFTVKNGKFLDRDSDSLRYGCLELQPGDGEGFGRRVMADLSRKWADLRDSDWILLTGGGALNTDVVEVIRGLLKNRVDVVDNPLYANALGMRKLGLAHERASQNHPVPR